MNNTHGKRWNGRDEESRIARCTQHKKMYVKCKKKNAERLIGGTHAAEEEESLRDLGTSECIY